MATISDVARLAGVSPATVSRVLNRPEIVAAPKRELVLAAINELGFHPSMSARSLRTGSTRSIALLVGDISQPFHGAMAKAVALEAEEAGYSVLLGDLDHRKDRLLGFLRSIARRNVDGVLVSTAGDIGDDAVAEAINTLVAQGVSVVSTVPGHAGLEIPNVGMDYRALGSDAAGHVLDQGRRDLLYVGVGKTRYSQLVGGGVRAAAKRAGARVTTIDTQFQPEPAREAVTKVLAGGVAVDAVVAPNTSMAIGALRALADAGRSVPSDVAVICCESVQAAAFTTPSLTTIGCDMQRYGRVAARTVIDAIEGAPYDRDLKLVHELTPRESTARP